MGFVNPSEENIDFLPTSLTCFLRVHLYQDSAEESSAAWFGSHPDPPKLYSEQVRDCSPSEFIRSRLFPLDHVF